MKWTAVVLFAAVLPIHPLGAWAQEDGDEQFKTIVLDDPHELSGTWRVMHEEGTMACPQMTMPIPAGDPETVRITALDGGTRLEMQAPEGRMTLRRATADYWEIEENGESKILRKKGPDSDGSWIAWATEGTDWMVYEGTLTPTAGVTIHYVMGWTPGNPDRMPGHLTSTVEGCRVTRGFDMQRR